MPQSQTAANPRHQKEEKKDKNKQTNVREAQRPAPSPPSEMIRMLKHVFFFFVPLIKLLIFPLNSEC